MYKKCAYIIAIGSLLLLQSCGVLIFNEDKMAMKKLRTHEEQYQPYKLQNTIEGYKEFIAKYPKNLFVKEAQLQIENLEFAPYEQADTIEGYMEFKIRYSNNRHVSKANVRIEQVELKRYEKTDTIEDYKEFLSKYPASTFAMLAKERLQELEFREFGITLRKKYGFDLLLYRLHLRRLKKKLHTVGGINLANFTPFASITTHEGKNYFHTHLIYSTNLSYLDTTSKEVSERFFDPIISKSLVYLDSHFMKKGGIDGFSFDVSSSTHSFYGDRKVLLEYYFPLSQVALFAQNKLDKKNLLAQSMVVTPRELIHEAKKTASAKVPQTKGILETEEVIDIEKIDGFKIMTMVSERARGQDYIISRTWKKGRHTMKTIERRKNFRGKDGFIDKSIIRYIDPPTHYGTAILTWNYKERESAFWYRLLHLGDASRVPNTERIRPPAESDFCFTDYLEVKVEEEQHELLRSENYEGKDCFVVKSTPVKKSLKYGKRISWIDQSYFIPLKIDYFDKKSELWKILHIEWQNKFGFWFWKKAVIENVQIGYKTFVEIEDVRINVGLHDKDFTKYALEQKKLGF